jgi:hypothetical protein
LAPGGRRHGYGAGGKEANPGSTTAARKIPQLHLLRPAPSAPLVCEISSRSAVLVGFESPSSSDVRRVSSPSSDPLFKILPARG